MEAIRCAMADQHYFEGIAYAFGSNGVICFDGQGPVRANASPKHVAAILRQAGIAVEGIADNGVLLKTE